MHCGYSGRGHCNDCLDNLDTRLKNISDHMFGRPFKYMLFMHEYKRLKAALGIIA